MLRLLLGLLISSPLSLVLPTPAAPPPPAALLHAESAPLNLPETIALPAVGTTVWREVPPLAQPITLSATPSAGASIALELWHGETPLVQLLTHPLLGLRLGPDLPQPLRLAITLRTVDGSEPAQVTLQAEQLAPATMPQAARVGAQPDAWEDNWSRETAAPLSVGVPISATFVCPVVDGCVNGDHDLFRVPVKAGLAYQITALTLAAGVDPVIDLFWGDPPKIVASHDDLVPGVIFDSQLTWVAPADGELFVQVAPRTGSHPLPFDPQVTAHYQLAIALEQSDLARTMAAELAARLPVTPTAVPTVRPPAPAASPAPPTRAAPPPAGAPATTASAPQPAPTGEAIVTVAESALHVAPNPRSERLTTLPAESIVTLLGQSQGAWVRVQPETSVLAGWMFGPDLRRAGAGSSEAVTVTAAITATASMPPDPPASPAPATPSIATAATVALPPSAAPTRPPVVVEPRPPLPLPPAAPPLQQRITEVTATVATRDGAPVPNVAVQVQNAFGEVLTAGRSDRNGRLVLRAAHDPRAAVRLVLPAWGIDLPLSGERPTVTVQVPSPEAVRR